MVSGLGVPRILKFLSVLILTLGSLLYGQDNRVLIVMIGPTGAGKTTQSAFIKKRFGIPTITVDDVIHAHPDALAKYTTPGIDPGPPQASPAVNALMREALSKADLSHGVVLDGYPATKEQASHLDRLAAEFHLRTPIILQLDVGDDEARKRLAKRAQPDDKPDLIAARLKNYHRELDMIRDYYPKANIWTVDGAKPIKEVSETIEVLLQDYINEKR